MKDVVNRLPNLKKLVVEMFGGGAAAPSRQPSEGEPVETQPPAALARHPAGAVRSGMASPARVPLDSVPAASPSPNSRVRPVEATDEG